MRIAGLVPDRIFPDEVAREREDWIAQGLGIDVSVRSVAAGPDYLESAQDQVLASPGVLALGIQEYESGADALALLCMSDPAIDALREAVPVPVIGAAQATMLLASAMARRAVVVTILATALEPISARVRAEPGGADIVAGIDHIDMRIADMRRSPEQVFERSRDVAARLLDRTGADLVILGCTEMGVGLADRLRDELGVPVIDPNLAAFTIASGLVRAGLTHLGTPANRPEGG